MARTKATVTPAAQVKSAAARQTLIAAYVAAQFDADSTAKSLADQAASLVKTVSTHEDLLALRDAIKAAYSDAAVLEGRTEDSIKKARDMFWSRTVKRAKDAGVAIPVAEQTQEAKDAQVKREAAKATKRDKAYKAALAAGASERVAQAMADQAIDARKQKTPEPATTASPIVDDEELQGAFEWITADDSHRTIFLKWFEAISKATAKKAA